MRTIISGIFILFTSFTLKAEVILPRILGHNMVLQRNKPVCIWGTASAGEHITVRFSNQLRKTEADAAGNWKVFLDPMKASNKGATLIISGVNTITLQDILIGEVWLCSGQSNMEYTMRKNSKVSKPQVEGQNPVDEPEYANNPDIRIFLVNRKEQAKPDPQHKGWSIARDSALRSFSAAGYFFAKELYKNLKVPVGVISSAIPGSAIEPWIPAVAFTEFPYFKGQKIQNDPGKFYEPMIRTLAPYTLKGFLWYQGETNCFLKETIGYTYKMNLLINTWRSIWADEKLPFYFVQIAPFKYSGSKGKVVLTRESLPEFREAQSAVLKIPNTGMIVTTDLADNVNDIHPSYKWEVGRRLALLALSGNYGFKDLVASGPVFKKIKIKGNKAELTFSSVGSGLASKDGRALTDFLIAGADNKFVPALAVIKGSKVIVSAGAVPSPKSVRFAWDETAQPNFYNKDGLPARPFRSDDKLFDQFKPIQIRN